MSIEAMKLALEAFEDIKKYVTDDGAMPENWDAYHEKPYYALEALRQAIEEAEFDKAFDEYAESDEGKARAKVVSKQSFEQSIDKLIKHIKTRQQEAK
jgi:hypothetical protein